MHKKNCLGYIFSITCIMVLVHESTGSRRNGVENLIRTQTAFLDNLEQDIEELEAMVESGKFRKNMSVSAALGTEDASPEKNNNEGTSHFSGKPKGFTNRQFAGTVHESTYSVSGMCSSRAHPGIIYYLTDGQEDNDNSDHHIHVIDTYQGAATVSIITLKDIINVDWEDMACAPCSPEGDGHCIYVGDIGDTGIGPVNVVYKLQEPEEIAYRKEMIIEVDDIEVISYDSKISDSETLMVSPSGRIFIMECSNDHTLYEIVDSSAVALFQVGLPGGSSCPRSADISPDGKGFLFKMVHAIFFWYVDKEEDMKRVLSDWRQRISLPYLPEHRGTSIAWRYDGGAYFTTSEGTNEPLYRYDRIG